MAKITEKQIDEHVEAHKEIADRNRKESVKEEEKYKDVN